MRKRMQVTEIENMISRKWERGHFFCGETSVGATLLWVLSGVANVILQGRQLRLESGAVVLCGPGDWYMTYTDMDAEPQMVTSKLTLAGDWPEDLFGVCFEGLPQVEALLKQLLDETRCSGSYADDMALAIATQLLLTLVRQSVVIGKTPISGENAIILKVQQYVAAHRREQLYVPIVARCADVSASYLTALFRKNLGISPGDYIRRVKLEESRQMIREGELNFTQIAAALEYSTVHHFSRQFKDNFGMTPTEYAKSLQ